MAERDTSRIDETKGIVTDEEPKGAKAAAQGAGDPNVPSVGDRAESHHIAHANSKAGEREDEEDVEDSGNEGNHMGRDVINQNPIADEENPPGPRAADRPQVEELRGDRVQPGQERNVA